MAKILERLLCPDCERNMTHARVVHKKMPYTEGTAKCQGCGKRRYCSKYKVIPGGVQADE